MLVGVYPYFALLACGGLGEWGSVAVAAGAPLRVRLVFAVAFLSRDSGPVLWFSWGSFVGVLPVLLRVACV